MVRSRVLNHDIEIASTPILYKSSITRFQNKLKRFFTDVSFPVKRSESTKTCQV